MKRKLRDEIQSAAFGDLEMDIANLNADEANELQIWQRLKSDLHRLRETPEPQIGIERVRQAILNEEIAAKSPSSLPWAAGIAAASAVGAVAVWAMLQNPGARYSEVRTENSASVTRSNAAKDPWVEKPVPLVATNRTGDVARSTSELDSRSKNGPAILSPRHSRFNGQLVAMRTASRSYSQATSTARTGEKPSESLQPNPPTVPVASNEAPVVIVDSTTDEHSGANLATEVETKGDIVIGG